MSVELKNKVVRKNLVEFIPDQILPQDDSSLWRAFKGGCKASLALIYRDHFFNLYQYGLSKGYGKEFVKDSIQDLFVELWKYKKNLKDTDNIEFYLMKSLKRKMSKPSSGIRFDNIPFLTLSGSIAVGEASVEDKLIEEQTLTLHKRKVLQAIDLLSGRQQQAIKLKYFQNLKNEEIANHMAISVPSVYNLVSKAITVLRKTLNNACLWIIITLLS